MTDHALVRYAALTPAARLAALREAVSSAITKLQEAAAIYAAMVAAGDDVAALPPHLRQALVRIHERRMLPEVYTELGGRLRQRVAMLPLPEQQRVLAGEPVELLVQAGDTEHIEPRDPRCLTPEEALQAISEQGRWRTLDEQRVYLAQTRKATRPALPIRVLPRAGGVVVEAGTFLSQDDLRRLLAQLATPADEPLQLAIATTAEPACRRIDWRQWDPHLGRVSDEQLAKRIGCTVAAVFARRHKRGIPSHREQQRKPSQPSAPPAAAT